MYETLLALEKDFFRCDKMTDRAWLNATLHDDFREVGKSGLLFGKAEVIESFAAATGDRDIAIFDFEVRQLKPDCWMVHYITKDDAGNAIYRTSVWVREGNLKLIFHQASKLNEKI